MRYAVIYLVIISITAVFMYPSLDVVVGSLFTVVSIAPLAFFNNSQNPIFLNDVSKLIFIFMVLAQAANIAIVVTKAGYSIFDIFMLEGIRNIAGRLTETRYEIDTTASSGNPFLISIALWSFFRLSVTPDNSRAKTYRVTLLFTLMFMYTILTTEKWPSYLAIAFYVSGLIASERFDLFAKKRTIIFITALIFSVMLLSLYLRGSNASLSHNTYLLLHYVTAPLYGLGHWLLTSHTSLDTTYGLLSFIGPISYITSFDRAAGVFGDNYIVGGAVSNIFTASRYLIQDFGYFSPFLLHISFLGLAWVLPHYRFNQIFKAFRWLIILHILLYYNVLITTHNSTLLAACIAFVNILMSRKQKHEQA